MANQVMWFEIIGGDADRLQGFYSQLFGWDIDADNEMQYGVVSAEQAGIGGGIGPDQPGGQGYVTFYIGVDDVDSAMSDVERLGGKTVMEPMELPDFGVKFGLFSDPEGHVVGLMQTL